MGKSPSLLVDRVWLVRTTLFRSFAHHLVGKVVIQAAHLLITISTTLRLTGFPEQVVG